MIIRGAIDHVQITPGLAREMAAQGWRWSGHTHPGTDANVMLPSPGDYAVLEAFGQAQSVILDSLGRYLTFGGE